MPLPVVLGLDFGGSKIAAAVADVHGERLGDSTHATGPADSASRTFESGLAAARTLLSRVAPDRPLGAVGVCTFGIPGEDGVALAPTISGWSDLAFGRRLRQAFSGVPVRLATDVKAAAHAEATTGALAGCDPGIYLNLGTGLAVALVSGGGVVSGANGAAGEIGYNLRALGDLGLPVPALEEVVSGQALHRAALALLPDARDAADVFASDRPEIVELVDGVIAELAFHLVNLTIAVDPARIAVGGGMTRAWPRLYPALRRALDTAVPYPPDLVLAAFPFDAPLRGVLALATTDLVDDDRQKTPA